MSNEPVRVAIISSATFNAATVITTSVKFAAAPPVFEDGDVNTELKDVNGDGLQDLILRFRSRALQLTAGSTQAVLTGKTTDGRAVIGVDTVQIAH